MNAIDLATARRADRNLKGLLALFNVSTKETKTPSKVSTRALTPRAQKQIRKFREEGATLQVIADVLGYSMNTVFKYSASVPCSRRHNKTIRIHRRTGLAA